MVCEAHELIAVQGADLELVQQQMAHLEVPVHSMQRMFEISQKPPTGQVAVAAKSSGNSK